jgi:nicotinamidase-related amidase
MNALFIVDPQNDFVDPKGSLTVQGAVEDCGRLARFLDEQGDALDMVAVSLDEHQSLSIFHPSFWVDAKGNAPEPYTTISHADVAHGRWKTTVPFLKQLALTYTQELEKRGRYVLTIWPFHCLVGSWGMSIYPPLYEALRRWEGERAGRGVRYVAKGLNPYTEHYSALRAEVADPDDPSTALNRDLLSQLARADRIYIGGEALSHCVSWTIQDLAYNLSGEKITLLSDCSSPIGNFDAGQFFAQCGEKGITVAKSTASFL